MIHRRAHACSLAFALVLGWPAWGRAFPHVVRPGETLAQIAARVYGDPRLETVLVGANALDSQGGSAIVPGMRLEIPAPQHHQVTAGESWADLALTWLGDDKRADVLARANHAVAWVPPVEGLEIEIPAVVSHIASDGETSTSIAGRYLGDPNRGWELNAYNGRKEAPLRRGEVLLVPLTSLSLTEAGKADALQAAERAHTEGKSAALALQRKADEELPKLVGEVKSGRYVPAVARAHLLLGRGGLTRPQLAVLYRALIEAYVALDAPDEAATACASWKLNEAQATLDPRTTSPKIRAACSKH